MEHIFSVHQQYLDSKRKDFENRLKSLKTFLIFKEEHFFIEKILKEEKKKLNFTFFKKNSVQTIKFIYIPNKKNIEILKKTIEDLDNFYISNIDELKLIRENSGKKIFELEKLILQNKLLKLKIIEFSKLNKNYFLHIFGTNNITIFQLELYLESEINILISKIDYFIKTNF